MNAIQHLASTALGFIATNEVVQTTTQLPTSKSEIVALVSAVLVQSAIYGITKLFGWLKKKNEPKTKEVIPTPTPTI